MLTDADGSTDSREGAELGHFLSLAGRWTVHAREDPRHFDSPASIQYTLELRQRDHATFSFGGGGDVHDPETRAARRFEIEDGVILGCQVFLNMRWPSGNLSVCELETCRQLPHSEFQCPPDARKGCEGSSGVEWAFETGPDVDMLIGTYFTVSANGKIASRGFVEMLRQCPDEVVIL